MKNLIIQDKNLSRLLIISLIGSWFHQWISLGTFMSLDFSTLNFSLKWLLNNRNLLILILPLNLILFFLLVKKKDNNFIIFFVFFLSYFIGTINFQINSFSPEVVSTDILNIHGSYEDYYKIQLLRHLTFSLNILCTILILSNFKLLSLEINYEIIILISLSFLFLIVFSIFFQKGNLFTNPTYNLNIFGGNKIINSNGLSRSLLIIFIFVFIKLLTNLKKIDFYLIFSCFLLSYLIISNEGRLNFISLFIAILLILFLSSFSLKKKIVIFTIIFLTPLLTTIFMKTKQAHDQVRKDELSITETKQAHDQVRKDELSITETEIQSSQSGSNGRMDYVDFLLKDLKKNRLFGLQGEIRHGSINKSSMNNIINFNSSLNDKCSSIINHDNKFFNYINTLTTGRIKKWECMLRLENDFILGNGPEYDRKMLVPGSKLDILKQGQDVASGAVYALISGGIVGISCYLLILFKYFHMCIRLLILKEKNYLINDLFFLSSFVTVGYLIGRSFFENGFSSYGIDFLIFTPCYIFIFEKFNMLESNYRNP